MGGVIGLRYEAIPTVMTACGIKRTDHLRVLDGVRVMERQAIKLMNKA